MIDIHCHLLPGIDDGPPTLDAALDLARALWADGIRRAVSTPHVFPGRHDNTASSIAVAHQRFVADLAQAAIPLTVLWAGEARLTPEILDLLADDELPFLGRVGGYRTLLLEMPDGQVPLGAVNFVRRLLAARVRPVIVHPERNRALMASPDRLGEFVDQGCCVQVTAGSLVGQFGTRAEAAAHHFVARGWVDAVASDAHNLTGRKPRMRDAAEWLTRQGGPELAERLTVTGPARLCCREDDVAPRTAA